MSSESWFVSVNRSPQENNVMAVYRYYWYLEKRHRHVWFQLAYLVRYEDTRWMTFTLIFLLFFRPRKQMKSIPTLFTYYGDVSDMASNLKIYRVSNNSTTLFFFLNYFNTRLQLYCKNVLFVIIISHRTKLLGQNTSFKGGKRLFTPLRRFVFSDCGSTTVGGCVEFRK